MSKLIDVDKIDWQKGVFVNPNTDEPLPIIHKIATIEMLRDWQEEVKAIPLDKVKKAREEMDKLASHKVRPISFDQAVAIDMCIVILDKLIESEEK